MSEQRFEKLLGPGRIGKLTIRNRMLMAPMGNRYAPADGYVNERLKDYYEARARGGVGAVIVQHACVDYPGGWAGPGRPRIDDDRFIPGLSELAKIIQKHQAKAFIQIDHSGSRAASRLTKTPLVSSSPIAVAGGEVPRELTTGEIAEIIARYVKAVERASKAGFDGVEIIAGYGLLGQFVSPAWNKRRDAYGGDVQGRGRMLLEVIESIRRALGRDYPLIGRIYGEQNMVPDGVKLAHARELARLLEAAGVDAIHVFSDTPVVGGFPQGLWLHLAGAIKEQVRIPVIAVGKVTPELGEKALREGKADFIALGRPLIADPEFPSKVASDRLTDIRPCIGCDNCHNAGTVERPLPLVCRVNPAAGRERERAFGPAEKKKRVLVIGGGAAGMEVARVAASRGHEVLLYEKDERLGGQLLLAAIPPCKGEIQYLTDHLISQVKKHGVKVTLGKECTTAAVADIKPDVVIIATGATPAFPPIPGLDATKIVDAEGALTGKAKIGQNVIVIGGGPVGCEVAEFLAEKGKKVTILEIMDALAAGMESLRRRLLLERLAKTGVTSKTEVKCEEIRDRSVVVIDKAGVRQTLTADTIVVATGAKPNRDLYEELKGKVAEIHTLGDCVKARSILEAIDEGSSVGGSL